MSKRKAACRGVGMRVDRGGTTFSFLPSMMLKDTGGSRDTGTTGSKTPGRGGSIGGEGGSRDTNVTHGDTIQYFGRQWSSGRRPEKSTEAFRARVFIMNRNEPNLYDERTPAMVLM